MSDHKDTVKGHFAIFFCNIVFGLNIPLSKIVMPDYVSAYGMAFFRTTGALLFFWTITLFVKWERVPWRDLLRLAAASIFGVLLNQMLYVIGLEYASPVEAAVVVTFTPILTMLLAALFLREPISWMKAGGVFLGLSGAIILIASKYIGGTTGSAVAEGSQAKSILGILLCLLSGLFYALYLTAFRNLVARYKPVTVMRWMFFFSALFSVPFLYPYAAQIDFAHMPLRIYLFLGYTVFMATGVTYLLIPMAQKRLRPTVLSVYNYIQPITASCLALILGQDGFGWLKAVASLLVFAGVFLVTRSKSRAQMEELKR